MPRSYLDEPIPFSSPGWPACRSCGFDSAKICSAFLFAERLGAAGGGRVPGPNPELPFSYQYSYNQAGGVANQRMTYTDDTGPRDLEAAYTWDSEGRMTSLGYPTMYLTPPKFQYGFDAMGRLSSMNDITNGTPGSTVATATYGVAGEVLGLTYDGYNETRTYNNLLQLTRMTSRQQANPQTTMMDMQYVYTAGQNNGRITQAIDGVAGETVNYTYDALNRLASANTTNGKWVQGFNYDGFWNVKQTNV